MRFTDKTCRLCLRQKRDENLEEIFAVEQCVNALKAVFDLEVRKVVTY